MLKLKRVEIHGFKSFYDRTEMKFSGTGIAAVVGPNGCGKSNLSDAISWVLGEQSAKTLRGSRMEDVIFAGTRDKKALGMASVTMTLVPDESVLAVRKTIDDANPELPAANTLDVPRNGSDSHPFESGAVRAAERRGEVTITRRLYRSGDSEYLVNGRQARLRDIQDLFLGTGLGPESYAIIEQGRIGQILSNRPQDRRSVIEEAAGITKFKTRKRLAEAKLESAKQNLSRVFDILEEVTRQANSLKRQAAKTKRYGELKEETAGYLGQILAARFQAIERDLAKIAIELNLASAEWQKSQAAIAEHEAEEEKVAGTSRAIEEELTEARQRLADLKLEMERTRGRLEYQTKQIGQITSNLGSSEHELEALARQIEEGTAELDGATSELVELERACAAAADELASKASERERSQNKLTEQERALEGRRQNVLRILGESSGLKNRITHVDAQLASCDREAERARGEEVQSSADLTRIQQAKSQLSEQLVLRQTDLVSVQDQRREVESELQSKRAALSESRTALDRLRAEVARIKARKVSLEEVIQHRSYTTDTVKRLFTAVERGRTEDFQPVGVLADFLEVDPQFEKAAEEFLHDELDYVVVRNWTEGERGIELLRDDLNGRASFLVEKANDASEAAAEVPHPSLEAGTLTRLNDALRWTNGLTGIPAEQLPRISNCYVASERAVARELATEFPHCWFLTADGVNYHGHSVSGGKKSGAGPLALKRELRDLITLDRSKQCELKSSEERLSELERAITSLGEELDRLRSKQQSQEKDVLALDHESRKLAEETGRVQSRLSNARLELDRIARDRTKLTEDAARDRQVLVECEERRAQEEDALAVAREQLTGWQAELAQVSEEHAALRANQASLEERRRSLSNGCSRLEAQAKELTARRAHLSTETERMSKEKLALLTSNSELEVRAAELGIVAVGAEAATNVMAQKETQLRGVLAGIGEELKRLRTIAQTYQEQRSDGQVALARAESQLKHLEETCAQELNTSLAQLAKPDSSVPDEAELAAIESKHSEARRKIEALGPVNPQALEEFEEAQQRQEFLIAQRQDLLDSIRDTEKAIHEIDGESRKRFSEAFHAINANFKEMFSTLFNGGTGEMRLTDEDNLAESGIDIVASPPGKRLQSVLLLSGGEKSLTAMALLMSIFQYTPSPFCILDEVDAPLDEPNIERLTHLLKEMSSDTQFIVITHAKRTMEAAQSLYGVTMQEPGISKLVSVRFDPQTEAGRGARPGKHQSRAEILTPATIA